MVSKANLAQPAYNDSNWNTPLNANFQTLTDALGSGVQGLVDTGVLPLASLLIEPAKVLFLNNAMFVTCFSFFAFYALQAVAAPYRYTIAMAASAAFVWQGSQFMG